MARKLNPSEEEMARRRAARAGRPYPNPVDVNAVIRLREPRTRRGRRG